jgi:hypothetical protein
LNTGGQDRFPLLVDAVEKDTALSDLSITPKYPKGVMYGRRPQCKRNLTLSETFGCGHVSGL